MPGPCKNCGAPHAAFGYRRRGPLSSLSEARRTMIFVCGAPACRDRAEAWKRRADGERGFARRAADPPKPDADSAPATVQGSLF